MERKARILIINKRWQDRQLIILESASLVSIQTQARADHQQGQEVAILESLVVPDV